MRKLLALFLLVVLILYLAWTVFHDRESNFQTQFTPTPYPYADFTVHIPQKALLKNYVTVSVEAAPGTKCELTYIPSSGEIYEMDAAADASGLCEWRWKIDESDGAGDARLIFTVNGSSDTHFMQIFAGF
jgi:hypothetical protein